jgi:hypothetical protein
MPVLNSLVKVIAKPLPRMISLKAHAIVDYVTVGYFLRVLVGFGDAASVPPLLQSSAAAWNLL